MNRYEVEVAKLENRTPLFYYPYSIKLISKKAEETIARYFFNLTNSYTFSFKAKDFSLLNDDNMKKLSGRFVFHYDDSNEPEGKRIETVKYMVPKILANKGIDGFIHFKPNLRSYGVDLREGEDFEVIVGERVDIEQPKKLRYDDIPDLMGVN